MEGLYKKYQVTKNESKTDPDAEYFVLRIDKDPHARRALEEYAISVRANNEKMSDDLYDLLDRTEEKFLENIKK